MLLLLIGGSSLACVDLSVPAGIPCANQMPPCAPGFFCQAGVCQAAAAFPDANLLLADSAIDQNDQDLPDFDVLVDQRSDLPFLIDSSAVDAAIDAMMSGNCALTDCDQINTCVINCQESRSCDCLSDCMNNCQVFCYNQACCQAQSVYQDLANCQGAAIRSDCADICQMGTLCGNDCENCLIQACQQQQTACLQQPQSTAGCP